MRQSAALVDRVVAVGLMLAVGCAAAPAPPAVTPGANDADVPQKGPAPKKGWRALTREKRATEARALCAPWIASGTAPRIAAEGHKCLASVELIGTFKARVEGGSGYDGPGVDRAIDHLTKAIELLPGDLSIHEERLHVAISSPRTADAPKLLADSLVRYTGPDATEDWLSYSHELWEMRRGDVGLEYMRVLENRYPTDHRIVGNVGTFLIALKRDDEGLPYLRRAVELAPNDAIDAWNLGRFHEKHGDPLNAERMYRRAVSLEKNAERHQDMACNLGRFLATQGATHEEGCALAAGQCGRRAPGCAPTPAAP